MADRYTTTTTQGFGSRLGNALKGLLFGPLFIIAAIVVLWWNEGEAVQAITGLNDAASQVVEADASGPVPANNNKLVHVVGTATAEAPIKDADTGITFERQVGVTRGVETYQWKETKREESKENPDGSETTTTIYDYSREWSPDAINSSKFTYPEGHQNPGVMMRDARFNAADAKLGGWKLDANTLRQIAYEQDVTPATAGGWTKSGTHLYRGDPAAPKVGDIRVHYAGLPSDSMLSVLALQSAGGFATFVARGDYQLHLVAAGNRSANELIANKRKEESLKTWAMRGMGFFLMFAGIGLILTPLSIVASVVPIVGWFIRGGTLAIAIALSVGLTLFVIALAWLAYRPLIGVGLMLLAAAAVYGFYRWRDSRTPPAAAIPTAPTPQEVSS